MRGEHNNPPLVAFIDGGSSPHARGTRPHPRCPGYRRRFIPACAGNTSESNRTATGSPVHPRMRGEHQNASGAHDVDRGSSPHARGTPAGFGRRPPHCRSSPHARGTHASRINHLRPIRFIPACAGNTFRSRQPPHGPPVHPRMRGEHVITNQGAGDLTGSSPHARGTLDDISRCFQSPPVHPRMRGEHPGRPVLNPPVVGSSPHARGTHLRVRAAREHRRFIPACAGNTQSLEVTF